MGSTRGCGGMLGLAQIGTAPTYPLPKWNLRQLFNYIIIINSDIIGTFYPETVILLQYNIKLIITKFKELGKAAVPQLCEER